MPTRPTQEPPPERTYWELLPRRNLRRVLFLVLVLVAVVALKKNGGAFRSLLNMVAPPPAPAATEARGARPEGPGSAAAPYFPIKVVPRTGPGGAPP
jgi:hypothetical protein